MIYINHRINTIEELEQVPEQNGIELDIRYHEDQLILHHDPFNHHAQKAESFVDLLKKWRHKGPMILNIKTEGIEKKCIDLMNQYKIKSWFFLDLSMPYFVIYSNIAKNNEIEGFSPDNLAVRFSEYEPLEYALSFATKAKWIWVDCFTRMPLDQYSYDKIKQAGFKICIVSPELQKLGLLRINEFKEQLTNLPIDAVCTKRPDLWGQNL
jgi:hypothetical protein